MSSIKIGVCYRPVIHKEYIEDLIDYIDVLEITPEILTVEELKFITDLCNEKSVDMTLHCLRSSLFSSEGYEDEEIKNYFFINEYINAKYFSDHIAYSHKHGHYLSTVQAIPYTQKNIDVFKKNILNILNIFDNNILIENITQREFFKSSEMRESEFIAEVIKQVDNNKVKLLLDVTNMFITTKNNELDFFEYLEGYPLDKVECIHLSGYEVTESGVYQDTHSKPLDSEIIKIADYILQQTTPKYLIIERDFNIYKLEDILEDIHSIKRLVEGRSIIY